MVKTEEEQQADEGRFGRSQETKDVGCWQEKNCRSAKVEVGENQSSEDRLEQTRHRPLLIARLPNPWKAGFLSAIDQ
jgi:hypothetical protein